MSRIDPGQNFNFPEIDILLNHLDNEILGFTARIDGHWLIPDIGQPQGLNRFYRPQFEFAIDIRGSPCGAVIDDNIDKCKRFPGPGVNDPSIDKKGILGKADHRPQKKEKEEWQDAVVHGKMIFFKDKNLK